MPNDVRSQQVPEYFPATPVTVILSNHRSWGRHWFEIGSLRTGSQEHSRGMMPGWRRVYATVISIGRLRVVFGPGSGESPSGISGRLLGRREGDR